jgi:histidyl-tRNA synthetase
LKPSIPKGTRDFSPAEMVRRNYILDTIKTVYQRFGFQQIETPAMENLSTLEGKYGDEGDKLLFRILNSGPILDKLKSANSELRTTDLTEKGLRYDLTVPFARYVVMHQNEITFPFKRYQIQPVWRADRPQKGRYREFVQCDADVIGSDSLLNEVEMIQMIDEVFSKLGIGATIHFNNRKILRGFVDYFEISLDKHNEFINILDNIEKVGFDKAQERLLSIGIAESKFNDFLRLKSRDLEKQNPLLVEGTIQILTSMFEKVNSSDGKKGCDEIKEINDSLNDGTLAKFNLIFNPSLARGLNYYTGAIFEVKPSDSRTTFTGSLLGGGRYDDLTGIFGLPNVSGVGISFGVDRIYDVMEEMKLFDQLNLQSSTTQVMFVNFGTEEEKYCLKLLLQVRAAGINAEIYPETTKKIGKQYSYADAKKIPYAISIGASEKERNIFKLKNMFLQKENEYPLVEFENIIQKIKNKEEI